MPLLSIQTWDQRDDPVPAWIVAVHVVFMIWTILDAHHPEPFVPGVRFFPGFGRVTAPFKKPHQAEAAAAGGINSASYFKTISKNMRSLKTG